MATQALKCERHGELTRLTCVDCGKPICPKCAVRTEVARTTLRAQELREVPGTLGDPFRVVMLMPGVASVALPCGSR